MLRQARRRAESEIKVPKICLMTLGVVFLSRYASEKQPKIPGLKALDKVILSKE